MTLPYLAELAADTMPFGPELAVSVANKLDEGHSLGYFHRDYCGMGLEKNDDGAYLYVELLDGYPEKQVRYDTRESFTAWLSGQSTASLARLNDPDPFFRGNQTITRRRLEEFLLQSSAEF